jgi:hypothetical protein
MDQHCSCLGLELPDFVLSNTILMMTSNTSKGQALATSNAVSSPHLGGKHSIVSMVMLDGMTHACSISFKELFSFNSFFS